MPLGIRLIFLNYMNIMNMNNFGFEMSSTPVSALTKDDIIAAAKRLGRTRPAKWTVIVEGRELPARPLVLEAAGVPPNDPTNSHQAVAILQDFGFDVRYQGKNISPQTEAEPASIDELIRSLHGRFKRKPGEPSAVEELQRERRMDDVHLARRTMGVYSQLYAWLMGQPADLNHIPATFQQIEAILGRTLPRSASQRPQWWENNSTQHSHASAWLEAGFLTEQVSIANRTLTFRRQN